MRSVAFLAAVCSIVVSEIQIGQLLDNTSTCQKLCHTQKTKAKVPSLLLKKALRGCCDEATTCVLPGHFYNVSCVKELLNVCNSENQSAPNLTKTQHLCCGNFSNETGREFKAPRKCFRNISVNWTDAMFWRVRNRNLKPIFKWKRKHWEFFLKMVTQACLNSTEKTSSGLTPSSVAIKFTYPTFAKRENYEKTFVRAVYAPASYLVMRKGDHDMLSILGESVKHLWVTLCICITWTVISGVIIWLLVSLVVSLFYKLSLNFRYSIGQPNRANNMVKWARDIDSSIQLFCRILFMRKRGTIHRRGLRTFAVKFLLPAGKSEPKLSKTIIKFTLCFSRLIKNIVFLRAS